MTNNLSVQADSNQDIPSWLPDYLDENSYPNPETTSAEEWAWEFLRRNPDYQRMYSQFQDYPGSESIHDYENTDEWQKYYDCSLKPLPKETWGELSKRAEIVAAEQDPDCGFGELVIRWSAKRDIMLKNFCIATFSPSMDPNNNQPPRFIKPPAYPQIINGIDYHKQPPITTEISKDEVLVRLSLAIPINPQLKQVREAISALRTRYKEMGLSVAASTNRDPDYSCFRTYLRYLDAETHGLTAEDITTRIEGQDKPICDDWDIFMARVSKRLDTARQYRDGGYKMLLKNVISDFSDGPSVWYRPHGDKYGIIVR